MRRVNRDQRVRMILVAKEPERPKVEPSPGAKDKKKTYRKFD